MIRTSIFAKPILSRREPRRAESVAPKDLYLTIVLGGEEYAVLAKKVRAIMSVADVMPLAEAPEFISGVMRRAGALVPVLDLRAKLGVAAGPMGPKARMIIVGADPERASGELQFAMWVDAIRELFPLSSARVIDSPQFGEGVNAAHLAGLVRLKRKQKALLDVDGLLTQDEFAAVRESLRYALTR